LTDRLVNSNVPLVVAGRPFNPEQVSYIDVDNVSAAYAAVTHLIRLGYKRIGTITGLINSAVSLDRKEGYLKALVEHGLAVDRSLIAEGDFSETSGYRGMQQLLAASDRFCSLRSNGDWRHGSPRAGLSVLDNIAFVGFDDLPLASIRIPQPQIAYLSSVSKLSKS
jgi:LacI family transcriptional regulator